MSRIVLAWELGANFGHLGSLAPLARALAARGHAVELVLRELHRGQAVLGADGFGMLQAPLWLGRTPPLPPAPSYAGVIRRCGYHAPAVLGALVDAWIALLDLVEPDLLVLDHAPTAALAARCLGVTCVRFGTGWAAPPAEAPLPSLTPWAKPDPRRLWVAESQVLASVNAVLKRRGRPALARLADLFPLAGDALATFPETDHYGARRGLGYWGALERAVATAPPPWPKGSGPRLFGFVDSGYAGFEPLVAALAELGLPALIYARDLPEDRAASLSTATLSIVTQPVDFETAVGEAALVICHGGHGAVTGALRAGRPLLLLPRQSEQQLLGYRVVAAGAAVSVALRRSGGADYAAALRRMLGSPSFADAAQGLAGRFAAYDRDAGVAGIADLCEAALGRDAPALRPAADRAG